MHKGTYVQVIMWGIRKQATQQVKYNIDEIIKF